MKQLPLKRDYQVQLIIEFLKAKIDSLKVKIQEMENPITQEMLKTSPNLQFEYLRLKNSLENYEDFLLTIDKFTELPKKPDERPQQNKQTGKR